MSTTFYRHRFLNLRGYHGGAYVVASVDVERVGARPWPVQVMSSLTVSDCSRVVTIELDVHDAASARDPLRTIRALHDVVGELAEALENAIDRAPPGSARGPVSTEAGPRLTKRDVWGGGLGEQTSTGQAPARVTGQGCFPAP